MPNEFFVVDALNICKETSDGRARLTILLSLLLELKKKGYDFLCIFDESAYGEFKRQNNQDFYKNLTKNYKDHFSKIRETADEIVIFKANEKNCQIISNDNYTQYRQNPKYTWLQDNNRLVKVSVILGTIFAKKIDIETNEVEDLYAVWEELKPYLDAKNIATQPIVVKPKPRTKADIVFCVDSTESMQRCIDGVKAGLNRFAEGLQSAANVDFRLRLVE